MPTMKDFVKNSKAKKSKYSLNKKSSLSQKSETAAEKPRKVAKATKAIKTETLEKPRRRPGREKPEAEETLSHYEVVSELESDAQLSFEDGVKENPVTQETSSEQTENKITQEEVEAAFAADEKPEKIEIRFAGSELIRARIPKVFDVAEAVATDWVHDGKFEALPISHPLANWAAKESLQKAKEVEKKVLESPQFEKAAMTALTWGLKAQTAVNQLRERLNQRKQG